MLEGCYTNPEKPCKNWDWEKKANGIAPEEMAHLIWNYMVCLDLFQVCTVERVKEIGAPLKRFKPSSKIFLLTVPRSCFFCGSFMFFLSWFCYAFVHVCLLMLCGYLLGKGWPLGSRLWCLIVKLSLSHWCPWSMWCLIVSLTLKKKVARL